MSCTREEITNKLTAIFQEVFDDDSIKIFDEMTSADIEDWDSFMQINLIVSIESEFKVQLNAADVGKLENVGEIIKLLESKTSD